MGVPSLSFVYPAGWCDAWGFGIVALGDPNVDYEAIANILAV